MSAVGSYLVISRTTGWLLAAFVSVVGWGLIGPGLAIASANIEQRGMISPRLGRLGRATGWFMALGLAGAVPAAMRLDNASAAPWWSWIPFAGAVSTFLLLPIWAIGLARRSKG